MDLDEAERRTLMAAGGAALTHNAPLSAERAIAAQVFLADMAPRSVVDLGCGRGAFAHALAQHLPATHVLGVDSAADLIEIARDREPVLPSEQLDFQVADAADVPGPFGAVVCIGASHAFGDPSRMFERLLAIAPGGYAVVGDGIWEETPNDWCLETFGEQPAGLQGLATLAQEAGWTVEHADLSTREEWDDFEHGWCDGVRNVGSPAATTFADERSAEYQNYRGVLGFGWLHLVDRSVSRP